MVLKTAARIVTIIFIASLFRGNDGRYIRTCDKEYIRDVTDQGIEEPEDDEHEEIEENLQEIIKCIYDNRVEFKLFIKTLMTLKPLLDDICEYNSNIPNLNELENHEILCVIDKVEDYVKREQRHLLKETDKCRNNDYRSFNTIHSNYCNKCCKKCPNSERKITLDVHPIHECQKYFKNENDQPVNENTSVVNRNRLKVDRHKFTSQSENIIQKVLDCKDEYQPLIKSPNENLFKERQKCKNIRRPDEKYEDTSSLHCLIRILEEILETCPHQTESNKCCRIQDERLRSRITNNCRVLYEEENTKILNGTHTAEENSNESNETGENTCITFKSKSCRNHSESTEISSEPQISGKQPVNNDTNDIFKETPNNENSISFEYDDTDNDLYDETPDNENSISFEYDDTDDYLCDETPNNENSMSFEDDDTDDLCHDTPNNENSISFEYDDTNNDLCDETPDNENSISFEDGDTNDLSHETPNNENSISFEDKSENKYESVEMSPPLQQNTTKQDKDFESDECEHRNEIKIDEECGNSEENGGKEEVDEEKIPDKKMEESENSIHKEIYVTENENTMPKCHEADTIKKEELEFYKGRAESENNSMISRDYNKYENNWTKLDARPCEAKSASNENSSQKFPHESYPGECYICAAPVYYSTHELDNELYYSNELPNHYPCKQNHLLIQIPCGNQMLGLHSSKPEISTFQPQYENIHSNRDFHHQNKNFDDPNVNNLYMPTPNYRKTMSYNDYKSLESPNSYYKNNYYTRDEIEFI